MHATFESEEYRRWCTALAIDVTADPLWRMAVYRLSLFLLDMAWEDAVKLDRGITRPLAGQLYRAVASITANIAEGYARQSGRDRARFYEYALGSAREAIVWYRAARRMIGDEIAQQRVATLTEIRRLLLVITPAERVSRPRRPSQ